VDLVFLLGWVSSVICETLPAELIADVDEELPIAFGGVFFATHEKHSKNQKN